VPALAPTPSPPAEVRLAEFLVPRPGAFARKRFHVKALRWNGTRLADTEFENVQTLLSLTATGTVSHWKLSTGTATESAEVASDGRVFVIQQFSWQKDRIGRDYPAGVLGAATVYEWTGDPSRGRDLKLRVVGRETLAAAGRTFQTVVFEGHDGMFRSKTWQAAGFGEVQSEVRSGPVLLSRRRLVAIER